MRRTHVHSLHNHPKIHFHNICTAGRKNEKRKSRAAKKARRGNFCEIRKYEKNSATFFGFI